MGFLTKKKSADAATIAVLEKSDQVPEVLQKSKRSFRSTKKTKKQSVPIPISAPPRKPDLLLNLQISAGNPLESEEIEILTPEAAIVQAEQLVKAEDADLTTETQDDSISDSPERSLELIADIKADELSTEGEVVAANDVAEDSPESPPPLDKFPVAVVQSVLDEDVTETEAEPEQEESFQEESPREQPDLGIQESPIRAVNDSVLGMETVESNAFQGPADRLMNVFTCGRESSCEDSDQILNMTAMSKPKKIMDLFYDKLCTPQDFHETPTRVVFDEEFQERFVQEMMEGVSLMELQPPNSSGNETYDWKGRSVTMRLEPGKNGDNYSIQPKISWITQAGGQNFQSFKTEISLLRIHSIVTAPDVADPVSVHEASTLTYFTITTDDGQIHVFEAASPEQREYMVLGLRNVIARLSFHLVAGDAVASQELWESPVASPDAAELPSLVHPNQTMNRLTHVMLD